ncbi:MAG: CpsD/CapB family tyrosine-protein kinase, partial [Victivallaceae bacterium]
ELINIKTNLHHRNIENPQRSIVISSDAPGVGKSSFCVLLAQLLADEENKVLLIDCDLRKPSLMQKLDIAPDKGFVQCLLDMKSEQEVTEFIVPTKFNNVDFMSNGESPQRPTDFFSSRKFSELLHILKQKYRYVILDAPPAVQMADAFLIANSADGVILLGRYGVSRSDVYKRLLKTWEPLSKKILGVVLTFTGHRHGSYYYYYGEEHEVRRR